MLFSINGVFNTDGNNYFKIIGEHAKLFPAGSYLQVRNSTGNDGIYKVSNSINAAGYTNITVEEPIASSAGGGHLNGGVYQIDFSDIAVPDKTPIILAPAAIDSDSLPVSLPGRGAWNYGERLVENTVHLLENFASLVAPLRPTTGQHWFDYSTKTMKVFVDGEWSSDVNVENGKLSFKDPQNAIPTSKIFITATEPEGREATGLSIIPENDVAVGESLFRVLDVAGNAVLNVTRSNAVISNVRFVADSSDLNEMKGSLAVGTPTTPFSNGSTLNVKGHIDVSGRIIFDDSSEQTGLIGLQSGSTLKTIDNLWTIKSNADAAAAFHNNSIVVASIGARNDFETPTFINSTLNVSGVSSLSTTNVNGTATATTLIATTDAVTPKMTVTGTLVADSSGTIMYRQMDMNQNRLVNVPAPEMDTDVANKKYVDDLNFIRTLTDVQLQEGLDSTHFFRYNTPSGKWVNTQIFPADVQGFGDNTKDTTAEMILSGAHIGVSVAYDTSERTLSFIMDPRPINVTGDVSGVTSIDWAGQTALTLNLPNLVSAGSYTRVTVDAKGRVISGGTLTANDIPQIPSSKIEGNIDLNNTRKVVNAIDPTDPGDYVTLRYLNSYTFDGGTF